MRAPLQADLISEPPPVSKGRQGATPPRASSASLGLCGLRASASADDLSLYGQRNAIPPSLSSCCRCPASMSVSKLVHIPHTYTHEVTRASGV